MSFNGIGPWNFKGYHRNTMGHDNQMEVSQSIGGYP